MTSDSREVVYSIDRWTDTTPRSAAVERNRGLLLIAVAETSRGKRSFLRFGRRRCTVNEHNALLASSVVYIGVVDHGTEQQSSLLTRSPNSTVFSPN